MHVLCVFVCCGYACCVSCVARVGVTQRAPAFGTRDGCGFPMHRRSGAGPWCVVWFVVLCNVLVVCSAMQYAVCCVMCCVLCDVQCAVCCVMLYVLCDVYYVILCVDCMLC